jgi:hypothetical protein
VRVSGRDLHEPVEALCSPLTALVDELDAHRAGRGHGTSPA